MISSSAADARPISCKPNVVPLAITRTNGPWTHTSDDSCICQLSLVLATATISLTFCRSQHPPTRYSALLWRAISLDPLLPCRAESRTRVVDRSFGSSVRRVLVIGGNEARPQYLQSSYLRCLMYIYGVPCTVDPAVKTQMFFFSKRLERGESVLIELRVYR